MKDLQVTEESIEKFRDSLFVKGKSSLTVKSYCADMTGFLRWAATKSGLEAKDFEVVAATYLNETRATAKPKTTLRRLTSLRSYAASNGVDVLKDYIAPKPGKPQPHPISEGIDGGRKMIQYAATRETKALVTILFLVGARISEARSLTTDSFNLHERTITIRGKGDKTRTVPMSNEAWETIADAYLRAMKDGKPLVNMNDSCARAHVTRIAKRAGISRRVSSHDGRATFATGALDGGANVRVVQELLGHSSLESTQVYTGVTMKSMREAVNF
jgi:site-specific recombinase XerD